MAILAQAGSGLAESDRFGQIRHDGHFKTRRCGLQPGIDQAAALRRRRLSDLVGQGRDPVDVYRVDPNRRISWPDPNRLVLSPDCKSSK